MDIVTVSIWLRYLQEFSAEIPFPAAGYKGDYVIAIAKELKIKFGDQFVRPIATLLQNLPHDAAKGGDQEIYIDALIARVKELLGADHFQQILTLGLKRYFSGYS